MTQKKAETLDDCQDAWHQNEKIARFAVADGATRSFFPKEWAELLVEHFCEAPNPFPNVHNWRTWLKPIQDEWHKKVVQRVRAVPRFYLVNSLNSMAPAASTFIGLEIDRAQGRWQAMIMGDSCLFHISSCGFKSYMIDKSTALTSHPDVLASYEKDNHSDPDFVCNDVKPGDSLILVTDALAKWILEHVERDRCEKALDQFKQLQTENRFQEFVDWARTNEDLPLVNDDVTLMMISVESDEQVKSEEDGSAVVTTSNIGRMTHPLSVAFRLLFWALLAGMLGFVLGAVICFLILWVTIEQTQE